MPTNYSLVTGKRASSPRRVAVITAFLVVSTATILISKPVPEEVVVPVLASSGLTEPAQRPQPEVKPDFSLAPRAPAEFDRLVETALAETLRVPERNDWSQIQVTQGMTLSAVFENLGLPAQDWMLVTRLGGDSARLKHLKAGDVIDLKIVSGRLEELNYILDETRTLSVRRKGVGYEAATLTAALERRSVETAGEIRNSLFADGRKAGMADRMILEFADIFGYDIDFAQDLQEGDRFSVVYDNIYKDGEKLREGNILAAEFVNQGRVFRAVRFVDETGQAAYYTPEGSSLRKAFIRTPVDFARISSGFNLRRRHPILNVIRAHKGVDYAAAAGTPVRATGNGRIDFSGRKSGYGNVVVIRHGGQHETLYAHLSRFKPGLKPGRKVRQGEIIGYVGKTGLATAPHLHYEFRVDGIHKNPITVTLPRAQPLSASALAEFRADSAPLVARIEALSDQNVATVVR